MDSQAVDKLQGTLLAFGAIEILSGAIILVVGVFLGSLQGIFHFWGYFYFFTLYSGYPVWGPIFFIFTGSSSIASWRIPIRLLVYVKIGRYHVSAFIALVGVILLSINLAWNNELLEMCMLTESPDLCLYMGTSNNGLMSVMLIFTLLELCMTISTTMTWMTAHFEYLSGNFLTF